MVLALLLAGMRGILLVWPFMTSAVPWESSEYVVPETVTAEPGFRVTPCASANSVVPSRTLAAYVLPFIVSCAAARVMGICGMVDVTPLMTMTDPDAEAGMLNVVPDTVRTPPGVRVWPGAKM